jgi:hypothetical protein
MLQCRLVDVYFFFDELEWSRWLHSLVGIASVPTDIAMARCGEWCCLFLSRNLRDGVTWLGACVVSLLGWFIAVSR